MPTSYMHPTTQLIHPTRPVPKGFRALAPGTERASTVLFDSVEKWLNRSGFDESIYTYGTSGTPTTRDLQNRIAEWEGGFNTVLFPSGLAAVAYAFLPFVAPGDHVLIPSNVYDPVKTLCNGLLKRMNVAVEFFNQCAMSSATRSVCLMRIGMVGRPRSTRYTSSGATHCPVCSAMSFTRFQVTSFAVVIEPITKSLWPAGYLVSA